MEEIKHLLENFDGELCDLCFELLDKYGENEEIFEYACKYFVKTPHDGTVPIKQYFSKDEREEYKSIYGNTVDGLLNSCIKKCNLGVIPPENFYASLWNSFCSIFSTRKEKAFAFYYTLIDSVIPYQYLGKPLTMNNERFQKIIEKNKVNIERIKYIAKSGYNQRTERASLLLNCLNAIDDFESKVVVLSQAILIFNLFGSVGALQLDTLLQSLDKRIEELKQEEKSTEE